MTWLASGDAGVLPDAWAYTALMRGLLTPPQPPGSETGGVGRFKSAASAPQSALAITARFAHMYACRVEESLRLFDEMVSAGVRPNAVCVATLVSGCLQHADNETAAVKAADAARAHGVAVGDPSLAHAADSALIVGYCRASRCDRRRLHAALTLFAQHTSGRARAGQSSGQAGPSTPLLDVRTCNALIAALATHNELPSARRVLLAMDTGAAAPANAYTLCILMRGYGAAGDRRSAYEMWDRLRTSRLVDTVGLNAWLATCLACGDERRALQAFQTVKAELPHVELDHVTFGTLIGGMCQAGRSTKTSTRRALSLWAEMRNLGLPADRGIIGALFAASLRHLDVEVALRLRAELLTSGWKESQLLEYSQQVVRRLPPLVDVLAHQSKWAALGVFPAAGIRSEQSQLSLNLPCDAGGSRSPKDASIALALRNVQPAERVSAAGASAQPATISQEIFERKGWNEMEDSGWKPWRPWPMDWRHDDSFDE